MKMVDARCLLCGQQSECLMRNEQVARCQCGGERERVYASSPVRAAVHGDDIPGGLYIKHGICNEDGTPKRYDTKHDIVKALDKAGLRPVEEQIPVTSEETERNFERKGFEQAPRIVCVPGVLSADDEAERVAHWHATETQLQQETK